MYQFSGSSVRGGISQTLIADVSPVRWREGWEVVVGKVGDGWMVRGGREGSGMDLLHRVDVGDSAGHSRMSLSLSTNSEQALRNTCLSLSQSDLLV